MMEYRGLEYSVVQGIERGVWKWSASIAGVVVVGQAPNRSGAVAGAENAIDRALCQKSPGCPARTPRLTEAEGRSCIYVPITQDGKVVDSQGYMLDLGDE